VKREDIPEDLIYAACSQDCLTLAVGRGPDVHAVARLERPIPPLEWRDIFAEEWANPADGAIQRAIARAGARYGLVGQHRADKVLVELIPLGEEKSE